MTKEERAQVIRGLVRHQDHWVAIAKKIELQNERRKKIAGGWVEYQGGWMTIDQKLALTGKAAPSQAPAQIFIQQNFNIREEHRHLHVDGMPPEGDRASRISPPGTLGRIEGRRPGALPEGHHLRALPPTDS